MLTDQNGAVVTVTTSASTTVSRTTSGSLNDIKSGDRVTVTATGASPNLAATRITDSGIQALAGPPGGGFGGAGGNGAGRGTASGTAGTIVRGTVASVDGSTITVTESNGTSVSVAVNGSTPVSVSRFIPLSGIAVGDTVRVRGSSSGTSVAATSILDGVIGFGPPGQAPNGGGQAASNG
jgi:hypothetical protein